MNPFIEDFFSQIASVQLLQPKDVWRKSQQSDSDKCAPNKDFSQGSCFDHQSLIKIAKNYNKKHPEDKINYDGLSKKELWGILQKKFSYKCGEQESCWLDIPQVAELEDQEIEKNTFKPKIPKRKYQWLSNFDIDDVMIQYENKYPFFVYLGTSPIDFDIHVAAIKNLDIVKMYKAGVRVIANIFNLDKHDESGSHWVAVFIDMRSLSDLKSYMGGSYNKYYNNVDHKSQSIEFFDSYGNANGNNGRPPKEIDVFMKRMINNMKKGAGIDLEYKYNTVRHQYQNSECGVYCLNFITERLDGVPFKNVTGFIVKDKDMNERRKNFFMA